MELVRTMLKQMVRDGNQNLMDYVFGMLEQYASSLEQEVDERTKELVEEKRKRQSYLIYPFDFICSVIYCFIGCCQDRLPRS